MRGDIYVNSMNIGFEVGALVLKRLEFGLAGITGPSRYYDGVSGTLLFFIIGILKGCKDSGILRGLGY